MKTSVLLGVGWIVAGPTCPAMAIFGIGSLDPNGVEAVGKVLGTGLGSGVAISPFCVLTAKHVVSGASSVTIDVAGSLAAASKVVEHPTADLALLTLANPLDHYLRPWYGNPLGLEVDVVGFGRAASLRADHTGFQDLGSGTSGVLRRCRNSISRKGGFEGYEALFFDYDSPFEDTPDALKDRYADGGPVEGEGGTRRGDSGGGYLANIGGEFRLIGTHAAGINLGGPGIGDSFNSDFGDASVGVSLAEYKDWIEANCVPEPSALAALALGFGLCLVKHRSRLPSP